LCDANGRDFVHGNTQKFIKALRNTVRDGIRREPIRSGRHQNEERHE
jgi:hypothetical protein